MNREPKRKRKTDRENWSFDRRFRKGELKLQRIELQTAQLRGDLLNAAFFLERERCKERCSYIV